MIALFLAAFLQSGGPVAEDEVVVIGQRLQSLSVTLNRDEKGKFACGLSASSGDPSVDAQLCKTAARCAKKGAMVPDAMHACIDAAKPAILSDFAARVRAKRG